MFTYPVIDQLEMKSLMLLDVPGGEQPVAAW